MRNRVFAFAVLLAMCLALAVPVYGAQELKVQDVQVKAGETVYVAVELTQSTVANSLGILYSYDESLLEPIPQVCRWEKQGLLQDFNNENAGVWAVADSMELKGTVCVLAFRVIADGYFADSTITCKLTVKTLDADVGTYEATGKVSYRCQHQYSGIWEDAGSLGHSQTCKDCGARKLQSHSWVKGTTTPDEKNPELEKIQYTCSVCSAESYVIAQKGETAPMPTVPVLPGPTVEPGTSIVPPATSPNQNPNRPEPTAPTSDGPDQNRPTQPQTGGTGSAELVGTQPTYPGPEHIWPDMTETQPTSDWPSGLPKPTGAIQSPDHDHDHDHDHDSATIEPAQLDALWIVLAANVLLVGAIVLMVKRAGGSKKKK